MSVQFYSVSQNKIVGTNDVMHDKWKPNLNLTKACSCMWCFAFHVLTIQDSWSVNNYFYTGLQIGKMTKEWQFPPFETHNHTNITQKFVVSQLIGQNLPKHFCPECFRSFWPMSCVCHKCIARNATHFCRILEHGLWHSCDRVQRYEHSVCLSHTSSLTLAWFPQVQCWRWTWIQANHCREPSVPHSDSSK